MQRKEAGMAQHGLDQLISDAVAGERRIRETKAETEAVFSTLHCAANVEVAAAIRSWNASGRGEWRYEGHSTKVTLTGDSPDVEIAVEIAGVVRRADGHALSPREAWGMHEDDLIAGIRSHLADVLCMPRNCRLRVTLPFDFDPSTGDPEL
jgi:hypothetical protein